jgi:hypothetical protein
VHIEATAEGVVFVTVALGAKKEPHGTRAWQILRSRASMDHLSTILCPGLSLCAIALILFLVFYLNLKDLVYKIFAIYFVPGEFASQEILVLRCGQQNDLTPVD